jgi:hypothetical protein
MEELPRYYVTLKPISKMGKQASGTHNIAYVGDPAIEEVGVYLNIHDKRQVATPEIQKAILDYLKGCGMEKPAHWKEVTEEEYLSARELNLTTDPTSRESFNDVQKSDGSGQWLVRYEYHAPDGKPIIDTSRDFCIDVISLGRIYTEEEIKNGLSNSEFGNYSIWDYKGSYGCRHIWKRMIFFEDYEDGETRKVGFVPQVVAGLDDQDATTLNAFLSKDEKMQVVAPLLIPDKPIYRNDELGQYEMLFSKETIVELRALAMENDLFSRKDLYKDTHEGEAAPAHTVDQWIIEDENDKAYTQYNLSKESNPIGTWVVHSQVTDKDFWEKEIKANKKHAYSIEALINLTVVEMSSQKLNTNNITMEKEQVVLPDGEHLINGKIYIVEGGVVVATKEVTPEQEEVVEEVAEAAAEGAEELEEEKKEEETLSEEVAPEVVVEAEEDDRIAQLEKKVDDLITLVGEQKAEEVLEEEKPIEMSDNRPFWKKIADGTMKMQTSK